MPLPLPKYGLDSLYLFPRYGTRQEYEARTGEVCPPFDPTKPPKHWRDPNALVKFRATALYPQALVISESGTPIADADGKPMLDVLSMPKAQAATVNIRPSGAFTGESLPEVQFPLRPLDEGEELGFGLGGVVEVRNIALYQALVNEGKFTPQDRLLLQAIAKKLGI